MPFGVCFAWLSVMFSRFTHVPECPSTRRAAGMPLSGGTSAQGPSVCDGHSGCFPLAATWVAGAAWVWTRFLKHLLYALRGVCLEVGSRVPQGRLAELLEDAPYCFPQSLRRGPRTWRKPAWCCFPQIPFSVLGPPTLPSAPTALPRPSRRKWYKAVAGA